MCAWADSSVQETSSKDEDVPDSPTQDEFVSDTFNQQPLSEEDVRREMEQLGVKDDVKEGEELQGRLSQCQKPANFDHTSLVVSRNYALVFVSVRTTF